MTKKTYFRIGVSRKVTATAIEEIHNQAKIMTDIVDKLRLNSKKFN